MELVRGSERETDGGKRARRRAEKEAE